MFRTNFVTRTAGDSFAGLAFGLTVCAGTLAVFLWRQMWRGTAMRILVPAGAAILAGWLDFANVYEKHDCYQLPTAVSPS
ncbi:MAG: hypothetical protein AAGC57_10830 [Pseudomonadota bacterium]